MSLTEEVYRTTLPQMLRTAATMAGDNDRTQFSEAEIESLAASIKEHGLLSPITVRKSKPGQDWDYTIIAGERRFRAIKRLGWMHYPGNVVEVDDETASALMLTENTARADLDPIDEACAYQKRMTQFGWSADETAQRAGVSGSRVRARLKLMRLEYTVQQLTRSGQFPLSYAQLLSDADLPTAAQMSAMRIFNGETRPTLAWFQGIVLELQKCKQTTMLEEFELELQVQQAQEVKPNPKRIPRPMTHKAPVVGDSAKEIMTTQVAFWRQAAAYWRSVNSPYIALECDAAAKVLEELKECI